MVANYFAILHKTQKRRILKTDMKRFKKQTHIFIAALVFIFSAATSTLVGSGAVFAADKEGNKNCGTDTAIIDCGNVKDDADAVTGSGLWSLLLTAINILTGGIFIAAVGGVVYGSVLYTSAGGNQEQIKKAVNIFTNVVIGLIAFAAMWAFLQYLIPGGVFA